MLSAGVVSESGIPGPEEPPPAPLGWIHGPDAWYGVAGSRVRHAAWHRRHEAQGPHRKTYLDIALFADRLNSNGWPWYPQARVGKRRPIGSYEKTDPTGEDKCRGISPKWLAEEAATPARTAEWIRQLRDTKKRANAALALGGAASLHMLALDGDAKDPRIAKTLRDLAREHLPATPYARGRHDSAKFALLYRGSPDDPCTRVQGVTFKSTPEFGKAQLEILAQPNKSITIHGRHHETDAVWTWEGLVPGLDEGATPDRAPVITGTQLQAYVDAVRVALADDLAPVQPRAHYEPSGELRIDVAGLRTAVSPRYDGSYEFADDGRVAKGRDPWVYKHINYIVRLQPNLDAAVEPLVELLIADIPRHVVTDSPEEKKRWDDACTPDKLRALVKDKVTRAVAERTRKIADEGFRGYRVSTIAGVEIAETVIPYTGDAYDDPDIRALVPQRSQAVRRAPKGAAQPGASKRPFCAMRTPRDPAKAAARALVADRGPMTQDVSRKIRRGVDRFLRSIAGSLGLVDVPVPVRDRLAIRRRAAEPYEQEAARLRAEAAALPNDDPAALALLDESRAEERQARSAARDTLAETMAASTAKRDEWRELAQRVHLLKAPTGSGKTHAALQGILDLKVALAVEDKRLGGPMLFMAPSYSLIEDVVKRAEGMTPATDDVQSEDARLQAAVAEARAMGLRVHVYKGKNHHCTHEAFSTLTEAGIGTAHICRTQVRERDGDGWRTRTIDCPHREDEDGRPICGFWTQRVDLDQYDLIFLPSAYLTLPIPTEVRDVAVGLIADESIVSQILGHSMMPLDTVTLSRRVPRITKRDAAAGVIADEIVAGRSAVASVAHVALSAGEDPAQSLLDWARRDGLAIEFLFDMIDDAINVCGRAMDVHEQVDPRMTRAGAVHLIERRGKAQFLAEEKRFWQVVRDRVESIIDGTATGDRDARIQLLRHDGEVATVRVSFRRKNSLADLPTMLMDASADEAIIAKIYKGRQIETIDADCPPHLRVLAVTDRSQSDSSLSPHKAPRPWDAAAQVVDVRHAIDGVCLLFGQSRIGVAATKKVEVLLNTAWRAPLNSDWLHYNNVVGFDHMRRHAAMVVVGRQELPIAVLDALVGALTYDDAEPEQPIDRLGTGRDAQGDEVRAFQCHRMLPMRDGSDHEVRDQSYAGEWARRVQRQAREEQVRQAIGRLRPVYRDGLPPLLVYIGQSLPEDIVVDAVASLDDVVGSTAARMARDLRQSGVLCFGPRGHVQFSLSQTDDGRAAGTLHAQRGMARIGWTTAAGEAVEGFVPAWDMSPTELRRRVDRYGRRYRMPSDADTEIWILTSPEMDTSVVVRGLDPKMIELLGTMEARQVAEDAIEALADRVMRQANIRLAQAQKQASVRLDEPPECAIETAPLRALLTIRKRSTLDPANVLATLVVDPAMLPEGVAAALADVLDRVPAPIEVQIDVKSERVALPSAEDRVALQEQRRAAHEAMLDEAEELFAA